MDRRRRGRVLAERVERGPVGHVASEPERAGLEVAAGAGQLRAQLEEERRVDHASGGEQVADLADRRASRHDDEHAAAALPRARLVDRPQHPPGEHDRGDRQQRPGAQAPAPAAGARRAGRRAAARRHRRARRPAALPASASAARAAASGALVRRDPARAQRDLGIERERAGRDVLRLGLGEEGRLGRHRRRLLDHRMLLGPRRRDVEHLRRLRVVRRLGRMIDGFAPCEGVEASIVGDGRGRRLRRRSRRLRRERPALARGPLAFALQPGGLALLGGAAHPATSVPWRASQSSSSTAAARESSAALAPPDRCAIVVVKRSS